MKIIKDLKNRDIRFTSEREEHITNDHPEMIGQYDRIEATLADPLIIVESKTDRNV